MSNQVNSYTGEITQIYEKKSGTSQNGKEWANQEFLIQTSDKYPKTIKFIAMGKAVEDLEKFREGNTVTVEFKIEAKEYKGVMYNNVIATKVF